MSDLVRQHGEQLAQQPLIAPEQPRKIDEAERKALRDIYEATNTFYLESITKEVEKAERITDPQLKRYFMPFFEHSMRVYGNKLLDSQHNASTFVQEIADEYRRRLQR